MLFTHYPAGCHGNANPIPKGTFWLEFCHTAQDICLLSTSFPFSACTRTWSNFLLILLPPNVSERKCGSFLPQTWLLTAWRTLFSYTHRDLAPKSYIDSLFCIHAAGSQNSLKRKLWKGESCVEEENGVKGLKIWGFFFVSREREIKVWVLEYHYLFNL